MVTKPNHESNFSQFGGENLLEELLDLAQLVTHLQPGQRHLVGISGPPMSGARVLADDVVRFLNRLTTGDPVAVAVHLDGFRIPGHHFAHRGNGGGEKLHVPYFAPGCFDVAAFNHLLQEIMTKPHEGFVASSFDDVTDVTTQDGLVILPSHRIIIAQSPFFLDRKKHWPQIDLEAKLNQIWYLDTKESIVVNRCLEFYRMMGLQYDEAYALAHDEDALIARQIEQTKEAADLLLVPTFTE